MANAASQQALEVGKERLREFLESSDTGRRAVNMGSRNESNDINLITLDSRGRRAPMDDDDNDDEI